MSFKVGDKVICIGDGKWSVAGITGEKIREIKAGVSGPVKDDILIISDIAQVGNYLGLGFTEYPGDLFVSHYFRKLSDIQALHDYKLNTTILEDLSAPIKIGKGLPKPQELEKLQKL